MSEEGTTTAGDSWRTVDRRPTDSVYGAEGTAIRALLHGLDRVDITLRKPLPTGFAVPRLVSVRRSSREFPIVCSVLYFWRWLGLAGQVTCIYIVLYCTGFTHIHTLSTVYSCILLYTLCTLLTSNPAGPFFQRFTSFLQSHGGRKLNHSTCSFTDPTSESPTESNHQSGLLRSIY